MAELYDAIGEGYRAFRRPDPLIASAIERALDDSVSVVNVGAGTGSYEPAERTVIAVEPSLTMIRQRAAGAAPVVRALASALPFADASFDASLAVLTIHHWADLERGLAEMTRVARRRVVVLTHDPELPDFWLETYFPEMFADIRRTLPPLDRVRNALGPSVTIDVDVPHDCTDGFLGAYWRRPEAYLDAGRRGAISGFAMMPPDKLRAGLARLAADLDSGAWERRHGRLRSLARLDLGYRLIVAEIARPRPRAR